MLAAALLSVVASAAFPQSDDEIFCSDFGDSMTIPNQRSLNTFPRSIINSAIQYPPGVNDSANNVAGFEWDGMIIVEGGTQFDPTNYVGSAPGKMVAEWSAASPGDTIYVAPVWVGNLDLSGYPDDGNNVIASVTLPRVFVKRPHDVGAHCTVIFYLAQFDVSTPKGFRILGQIRQTTPAATAGQYNAAGPVTFDWSKALASLASQSNDPRYFASKSFLQSIGFAVEVIYTAGTTGGNVEIDMGFNLDAAHPANDPVQSWGTDGITINYAPTAYRGRGMML